MKKIIFIAITLSFLIPLTPSLSQCQVKIEDPPGYNMAWPHGHPESLLRQKNNNENYRETKESTNQDNTKSKSDRLTELYLWIP